MSVYKTSIKVAGRPATPVTDRETFLRMREETKKALEDVRAGKEERKKDLVTFVYGALPNDDGTLKEATRVSSTIGMDGDHIPDETMPTVEQRVKELKDRCRILFAERSPRGHGVHIVFERNPELTTEENLQWMTEQLGIEGVEYDKGAKDLARVFFGTSNDPEDLWILDDRLFEVREVPNVEKVEAIPPRHVNQQIVVADAVPTKTTPLFPADYNGTPYAYIVEELEAQYGGAPQVGDRNNTILKMASDLAQICDRNPEWIFSILPDYGLSSQEVMTTIRSACSYDHKMYFSLKLRKAIKRAKQRVGGTDEEFDSCPPPMPEKLPGLVKLLLGKTPEAYRPAVAHAVFPALASHLFNVRFKYIDNQYHEATLMNVLMAETGAGKSCIDKPIQYIMEDIVESDSYNRERESQWKRENRKKGANKDKEKRPDGLVIQYVQPDMTNAAFIMRTKEAEGHFLYTKANEIEAFDRLSGGTKGAQFTIMCNAFDYDNSYGAERVGNDSVSETVCVRFNFNACTTFQGGKTYFRTQLIKGALNRINFCTIPKLPIGSEMPIYGVYDDKFRQKLKPYIDRLKKAEGEVSSKSVSDFAKLLSEELRDESVERDDVVYENFSYRANVIAFLKAMVLYIAEGNGKFTNEMKNFVRWSLHYDLWCKMQFFGEDVRKAMEQDHFEVSKRGQKGVLDYLPSEFTEEEIVRERIRLGMNQGPLPNLLRTWKSRKKIEPVEGKEKTYRKLA